MLSVPLSLTVRAPFLSSLVLNPLIFVSLNSNVCPSPTLSPALSFPLRLYPFPLTVNFVPLKSPVQPFSSPAPVISISLVAEKLLSSSRLTSTLPPILSFWFTARAKPSILWLFRLLHEVCQL